MQFGRYLRPGPFALSAAQGAAPVPNVALDFPCCPKQAPVSAQQHRHSGYSALNASALAQHCKRLAFLASYSQNKKK